MLHTGPIIKMRTELHSPIQYKLPIGEDLLPMNQFIGKYVRFKWLKEILCILCERKTNKSFSQGFCYPCFINSPETSECILRPELCEAQLGNARDMDWAEKHCLQPHFVYLAVSSGAASRDPEHDTIAELSGGMVVVNQGSVNDNKIFLCTTDSDGSIGSTNITYTVITPSNTGTVTSVGLTQSGTEFTIGSTPITSSGNITINVNRIAATKIGANTNVSDTEFGYLANVSSDIQTQIDAKATQGFATAMAIAL